MARPAIIGSRGRMGQALMRAIEEAGLELAGAVDKGGDVLDAARGCDVLIDFSAPESLFDNLAAARQARVPIVIGTTGLREDHHRAIDEAAQEIAVLQTGNTSLGITLLAHLVREAAARLSEDWDIEIVELHHRMKRDCPSGTALLLGEAAAKARGVDLDRHSERGRDGDTGARRRGAIGFASLRGGTAAGDHSVLFAGDGERLTLSHSAEDRMIFARGALKAAGWLIGKAPARYTMNDVLGI